MTARGVSPSELSDLSGLSESQIRCVLTGKIQFSDRSAADVGAALGVSPHEFSQPKTPEQRLAETARRREAARNARRPRPDPPAGREPQPA